MSKYTIISEYSILSPMAYEKFPFGRDWSLIGEYDECYAAICQYLMRRYKQIEQSYDPMCLLWKITRDVFFEHGDEECTVDGETIRIIKI